METERLTGAVMIYHNNVLIAHERQAYVPEVDTVIYPFENQTKMRVVAVNPHRLHYEVDVELA